MSSEILSPGSCDKIPNVKKISSYISQTMVDFSREAERERGIAVRLGIPKLHLTNYDRFLILWLRERNISSFEKCCLGIPKRRTILLSQSKNQKCIIVCEM